MLSIQGYFDGVAVKPLEKFSAKPNQRVITTIMDEFVEPVQPSSKTGIRGALAQYANPESAKKEKEAWEHAAVEKYGNI